MGHRGNFVIVNKDSYEVKAHKMALVLPLLMFWGYDFIIDFFSDHHSGGWFNTVWDEGSVLIDTHKKLIIIYGGEHISYHLPHKKTYLQLMKHIWSGYDIQWGHRGLIDILNYVKSHPFDLTREGFSGYHASHISELEDHRLTEGWPAAVISIKLSNNDLRVQYTYEPYNLLPQGDTIVDKMREVSPVGKLDWDHDESEFPFEGVHIDVTQKQVYFWSTRRIHHPKEFQNKWEGWEFIWLKDDYQTHINLTEGRLRLPIPTQEQSIQYLKAYLLINMTLDEYKTTHEYGDKIKSHGLYVPYYPIYYLDQLPPIEERTEIFNRAVDEWRASSN